MSNKSGIEWTDSTWNPIVGCSIVSPGCTNCYAMKMAYRIRAASEVKDGASHYCGTVKLHSNGMPIWTGKVAQAPEKTLMQPLSWKRPRRVFVNSMGDLFHESIPDEWIDRVFAVMALCPQHQFQVLTKRAERMREYMSSAEFKPRLITALRALRDQHDAIEGSSGRRTITAAGIIGSNAWAASENLEQNIPGSKPSLPLPNVWLGVSAERQQEADERIPHLLQTPAAIRFVSCEPLLGPIDLVHVAAPEKVEGEDWRFSALHPGDCYDMRTETCLGEERWLSGDGPDREHKLDWIIVGGESGKDARPMQVEWVDSIAEQCNAAGVACFVKQLGSCPTSDGYPLHLKSSKGGDWSEWPDRLRVREWPSAPQEKAA